MSPETRSKFDLVGDILRQAWRSEPLPRDGAFAGFLVVGILGIAVPGDLGNAVVLLAEVGIIGCGVLDFSTLMRFRR